MNSPTTDSDRSQWLLRDDTTYLNHGSFGPPTREVWEAQRSWQLACSQQPMDFYLRQMEPAWFDAQHQLARWIDCESSCLALFENATQAMNQLAYSFPLKPGQQVLLNPHEYGVVRSIWERRCKEVGAAVIDAHFDLPLEDPMQVVDAYRRSHTQHTALWIASHITSPTAITLPVERLAKEAASLEVPLAIDGPHAPLQVPLSLQQLDCDFYLASCHKWLSAPLGSGFLYANPRWHDCLGKPLCLSWGRLKPRQVENWSDHYLWTGTRDVSPLLTIPTAIDWFRQRDPAAVRDRNHSLAQFARQMLLDLLKNSALVPDAPQWYSMMAAVWLPDGDHRRLQQQLWQLGRIEVPIIEFQGRHLIRVSCHLYNNQEDIYHLVRTLQKALNG